MIDERFEYPIPLLIIAGKGGVGKTVVTAAAGTVAARGGHSTLLVELGGQRQLPPLLPAGPVGEPDADGVCMIGPDIGWVSFSPERLLAAWLSGRSMGLIADRLERSGALSVIASSIPGIKDVLVLGKLRALVESGRWDRIVVDGPATGRAREMLRAPGLLVAAVEEGPIASQAERAHAMLTNAGTSGILLVTLPEETPISETVEAAFDLEDDPGVALLGLVVNRVFPTSAPPPAPHPASAMLSERWSTVDAALQRLDEDLPLGRVILPERPGGVRDATDIGALLGDDAPAPSERDERPPTAAAVAPISASADALFERRVVVTVGTGGVGKTSIGAALALRAAEQGRRVALITIDPARRLADALGLAALDDELRPIDIGAGPGSLQATMLDPRATFARVVRTHAPTPDQAERILDSPLSSQLADALSGMTEYMAVERLWELTSDPATDLVVVDTPPAADALAFLDAPTLLARLLDNRIYRLLVHDGRRTVVTRTLGGLITQLISVVGGTVVRDAVSFFRNFEGMEEGFRTRGRHIHDLLRSDEAGIVVVASPAGSSLLSAERFIDELRGAGVDPAMAIVNRVTPEPGSDTGDPDFDRLLDHMRRRRAAELRSMSDLELEVPRIAVSELSSGVASLDDVRELTAELGP